MSDPDTITSAEILQEHGRETLDRMLGYGWHHTDDFGHAYWTRDEAERILDLIEPEEKGPRDEQ
jgi:hypothetical protein